MAIRRATTDLLSIFMTRTAMAGALVFVTYNPTDYSFLSYIGDQLGSQDIFTHWGIKALAALVLGIFWWIFLRTAYHSLKAIALAIAAALILGAYLLITKADQLGYTVGQEAMIWVVLVIMTLLLGIGASTSHFKMRWAGIRNTEDVDTHHS